jgi:uncharacterized hydrophobic protein (TIGR00271 family)
MAIDTEAPAPVSNKHDIASLKLESTKANTEDELEERPGLNERRMVRSAEHLNLAYEKHVEGETKASKVRMQHVVKIFQNDADDFIEVSPEQVARIRMMHERIEQGAYFSFNYNTLLLVASVVAGCGLISNSSASVIASMLVSPIMGPVVGLAYGSTIRDWKLVRLSLRNECISLAVCILVGVIIGAIGGVTTLADDWPTPEMRSRGTWTNFVVALPVAFFSGLGVAVSLLDDQTSSLVGVAISASLLPPAVNSGILWLYYAYVQNGTIDQGWSDRDESKLVGGGVVSLLLTLANIILIWAASMFMFRMKEVLPIDKKVFWEDLGVARKIYRHRALLEVVDVQDDETDEEKKE